MIQPVSSLRIIAGKWRGRKITFVDEALLRPTQDRIRETVFNWLMPYVKGSRCLDLFAGSGALGFEALSRGANQVVFVDVSKTVIHHLKENATRLATDQADFLQTDLMRDQSIILGSQFDIVFLDPPFAQNLLLLACRYLEEHRLLKSNALIYLEFELNGVDLNALPNTWEVIRHKKTKTIEYALCQRA